MEAQAVATQLMIELCGARAGPGTIDIGGARAAAADDPPARGAGRGRCSGPTIPRARQREILDALEFDVARRRRRPRRRRLPAFRRGDVTPRGRPDRGGRAARRPREAAGDAAVAPRRRPGAARPPPPAAAPAGRRRAAGAGAARDRRLELHRPGPAPTGCGSAEHAPDAVELANPMSIEQSRLRTTLLGSLLDVAAAQPRARRRRRCGCSRPAPSTCPPETGELPREPYHLGALLIGPVRPATWRDRHPPSGRLLRRQGRARRPARGAAAPTGGLEPSPASRSCTPAARRAILVGRRGRSAGSARSTRWSPREWELDDTVAAFELDLDAVPEPPCGRRTRT